MQRAREIFSFPDPVDEISARTVATGVVIMVVAILVGGQWWILVPLTYGFIARVLTGPTLSPLGSLATRVIRPRLAVGARLTPGPPKRFAQAMGATFSASASIAYAAFGARRVAMVLVGALGIAASLEAFLGVCLGCVTFRFLMRIGVVPAAVCESCADIGRVGLGSNA